MFFPNIFVSCQLSSHFLISLSIGSILYNFEPIFFHPPYLQIYVILWLENLNCWLNLNLYNLNWLVWLALIMTGDTNLNYIPVVIFYPMLYFCNCQVFLTDFQRNHLIECYFKHLFIRFHCLFLCHCQVSSHWYSLHQMTKYREMRWDAALTISDILYDILRSPQKVFTCLWD